MLKLAPLAHQNWEIFGDFCPSAPQGRPGHPGRTARPRWHRPPSDRPRGPSDLVGHILAGIAQLVDDAVLDFSLGEGGVDSCVKSRQTVGTGDENILYTPVFQAVEYRCSAFGALIFIDPHAQNIFSPILVDANGDIDRFLHDLPLVADMVVDGVQKHHGVNGLQRPLLPFPGHGQDLARDPAARAI